MADEGAAALKRLASFKFQEDSFWKSAVKVAIIVWWALATSVVSVPFFLALTPFRVQRMRLGNYLVWRER